MNDPGRTTGSPVSSRRRHAALCCLVMLHVAALGLGLFPWPNVNFEDAAIVSIPFVFGSLAAIVSLAAIWLALSESASATRLTVKLCTLTLVWLTLMVFSATEGGDQFGALEAFIVCVPFVVAFCLQGLIVRTIATWTGWSLAWQGTTEEQAGSEYEFSVRHVLLWTSITAVVLAVLRVTFDDIWTNTDPDLMILNVIAGAMICSGFGLIHSGVALLTLFYVTRQSSLRSDVIAFVVIAFFTLLSGLWWSIWQSWLDLGCWSMSLPAAVHFVLLTASIILLRRAGYRFTRHVDMPTEALTT